MAEITLSYHPIGTRGFVADALKEVREVVVEDVLWQSRYESDGVAHYVRPADGTDLWHDRYDYRRIHATQEAADAELKANRENWERVQSATPALAGA